MRAVALTITLLLIGQLSVQAETNATTYFLSSYPLATCLDGSPAAYQLRVGNELGRILIFHEGGGECATMEECQARATTPLGSSANYTGGQSPLPHLYGAVAPYFDRDAVANPLFHNWTHIYVRYCDGESPWPC